MKKPNIICILTDDQGYWSLGCYGNQEIRTPNIDKLASEGIRFNNFFCTSPVCSPARASLLTGKLPSQHGIHDFLLSEGIDYLNNHIGYTDVLEREGYTCGISGKWHLGDEYQKQKGFDHWYVLDGGGSPYYSAPMIRDGKRTIEKEYVTDKITDDALGFIQEQANGEKPFYLSIHYTAPHGPWINNHPKELVDSYADCAFTTCPEREMHPWATRPDLHENHRENVKGYFAAITAVDQHVGTIMKTLEDLGIEEDTLIIYLSDNGFNCGHHGIWGKGNGTFPLNMFDTSIKIPCIFYHKDHIAKGIVSEALVSGYDFMPTLLDYLGIDITPYTDLPGNSFKDTLLGKDYKNRDHVVVYDEYGPVRMIRTQEYKYVHRYPYGPHELYHFLEDPDENHNLIKNQDYNFIVTKLRGQLTKWFYEYVDPSVDGCYLNCTGHGQIGPVGVYSEGRESFK